MSDLPEQERLARLEAVDAGRLLTDVVSDIFRERAMDRASMLLSVWESALGLSDLDLPPTAVIERLRRDPCVAIAMEVFGKHEDQAARKPSLQRFHQVVVDGSERDIPRWRWAARAYGVALEEFWQEMAAAEEASRIDLEDMPSTAFGYVRVAVDAALPGTRRLAAIRQAQGLAAHAADHALEVAGLERRWAECVKHTGSRGEAKELDRIARAYVSLRLRVQAGELLRARLDHADRVRQVEDSLRPLSSWLDSLVSLIGFGAEALVSRAGEALDTSSEKV